MNRQPLISSIMPTANRRLFVPRAIEYFLQQNYRVKELLILDDGEDSGADLIPDDPRIRYLRETRRRPMGAKRNALCKVASGEVIAHWDDDDWMAPNGLSYQGGAQKRSGSVVRRPPEQPSSRTGPGRRRHSVSPIYCS